jgi:hypothetical protein
MSKTDTRMVNETVIRGLTSDDNSLRKESQEGVNTYLRLRQREDGFFRKFFDVVEIGPGDLDKQVDTPLPVIVRDMEPNSAGAYTVPFGTTPMDSNITAPRYRIMVDRIMSHRYVADVNTLLTYDMDIRQVFNDFILKDILAEEDRKGMVVARAVVGTLNTGIAALASCLNVQAGGFSRTSLVHAMKGLPSTNRRLNPAAALVNNLFVWNVVALTRENIGGDLAEELFVNAFTERKIMGINWIITIKQDLVTDLEMFQFAEPKYLGDFVVLDNVTLSTKHEDFMLSFYAYESIGATIANIAGVCRTQFDGTEHDWKDMTP